MKTREPGNRPSPLVYLAKVVSVLIISIMVTVIAMSVGAAIVDERPAAVLTGIVSDSMYGADHGNRAAGDAECTRSCVESGAQYALVVGKKIYLLQGHQADLYRFAGERVLVNGRVVSRDTIAVEQVAPWYNEAATGAEMPLGSKQ